MKKKLVRNEMAAQARTTAVLQAETDPFVIMASNTSLAMHDLPAVLQGNRQQIRRQLVGGYEKSIQQIGRMQEGIDRLLQGVIEAFVWRGDGEREFEFQQEKLLAEKAKLSFAPLEVADALFAEVMMQDDQAIRRVFVNAVQETLARLFSAFQSALVELQKRMIVGSIRWFSKDVCIYDFYRVKRSERMTGESLSTATEVESGAGAYSEFEVVLKTTHFKTFDSLEHHEHQLYNAARYQLPAQQVRKPRFVHAFLHTIPAWMQPYVFIVEGDMLRETIDVSEKHIASREETFELSRNLVRAGLLYSPAVTLGSFVLTGWSKRDLG